MVPILRSDGQPRLVLAGRALLVEMLLVLASGAAVASSGVTL